jgi:hypothetical protein
MNKSYQEECCSQNNANDGLDVNPNFVELNQLVVSGRTLLVSESKLKGSVAVGFLGMTGSVLTANSVQVSVSDSSSLELGGCRCSPSGDLLGLSDNSKAESSFEFLNACPTDGDSSEWVMDHEGLNRVNNFGSNQENPNENGQGNEDESGVDGVSSSSCGCKGNGCACSNEKDQDEVNPAGSGAVNVGFEHVQNTTPQKFELNQLLLAKKGN